MALSIVWTSQARVGFDEIVEYLEINFTEREISNFINDVDDFLELLSIYPDLLAESETKTDVHRGPINKYTMLTYRVNYEKKRIELINLRSSRQRPWI